MSPLPCPLARPQKFDYQEGILRMKREKLQFAGENEEDSSFRDVSENSQTDFQEPECSTLSEDVLTTRTVAPSKNTTVNAVKENSMGSANLDDSVYDFQPTDSKYSVVRRSFGKFSVGVGHKKMRRGKFH